MGRNFGNDILIAKTAILKTFITSTSRAGLVHGIILATNIIKSCWKKKKERSKRSKNQNK